MKSAVAPAVPSAALILISSYANFLRFENEGKKKIKRLAAEGTLIIPKLV